MTPSNQINMAQDPTVSPPTLLTAGGQQLAATVAADGSFRIAGVPDGTAILKIDTDYYVTGAAVFDAGSVVSGRPRPASATQSTTISLSIDGLAPWQMSDQLEAYSPEADIWWFDTGSGLPVGATALSGFLLDNTSASDHSALINGALGDRLIVAQLTGKTTGNGVSYLALSRTFTATALSQKDGSASTLSGTFSDVSATHTLSVDLRNTQFDVAVGYDGKNAVLLNPAATAMGAGQPGTTFAVLGQPGGGQYGPIGDTADYLLLTAPPGAMDTFAAAMSYGQSGYGAWGVIGTVSSHYLVNHMLAGTTTPAIFSVGLYSWDLVDHYMPAPVTPVLGPVRSPTVAGRDLFQPQTGVGTNPTIGWQAPTLGTATNYTVTVYQLAAQAGATTQQLIAAVHTTSTSVVLPAGILVMGGQYVLDILATTNPDSTAPMRMASQGGRANIVSAIVSP